MKLPPPPPRFDRELNKNQRTIGYIVFSLPLFLSFERMALLCFPRYNRSFSDKRFQEAPSRSRSNWRSPAPRHEPHHCRSVPVLEMGCSSQPEPIIIIASRSKGHSNLLAGLISTRQPPIQHCIIPSPQTGLKVNHV